jgi:hypothetical protein
MPRQEQDREDLLRDATAMVERAELQVKFWSAPVFVGFRRDGSFSVYFGGDPVYQFNTAGQLRRAFIDGLLYKADHGRLANLRRERTETETVLVRHDLSDVETAALRVRMNDLLGQLLHAIEQLMSQKTANRAQPTELLGEVPTGANVLGRVHDWLTQHFGKITIATNPRVGGK